MNQRSLDAEMIETAKARYNRTIIRSKEWKLESTTPYGKRLMSEVIPAVAKKIDEDVTDAIDKGTASTGGFAAMFLHDKDMLKLSAMVSRTILDMVSVSRTMTSAAMGVAELIVDEVVAENMKTFTRIPFSVWKSIIERKGWKTTPRRVGRILNRMSRNYELSVKKWGYKEKLSIGSFLINCFIAATGLVETKNLFDGKNRTKMYLVPTKDALKWIEDYNKWAEVLEPVYLPMVVKPKRWEVGKMEGGGYDIKGTRKATLIKSRNRKWLKEIAQFEMPEVVSSVNAMQETAYKINGQVLEVMLNAWENRRMIGDLVVYKELPIPKRPVGELATKENLRSWGKEVATNHSLNDSNRSRSLLASKILYVATKFLNEPAIYFPHQVDFRGRAYPMPIFLNPQGNDLAKSLLLFTNGKPIQNKTARDWLLISGANLWGLDKKPFAERIAWVEQNVNMLHSIANDPYSDTRWHDADSPWLFLAWCFEFAGFAKRGYGYVSHMPVSLDATNNGLQILSLLMKDPVGAYHTNVTKTDYPQDIYGVVAEQTIKKLKESGTTAAEDWIRFGITRKTVKRPVMTLPYGSTLYSCRQYLEDWYVDSINNGKPRIFETHQLTRKTQDLAAIVWASMENPIGMARKAMKFIQDLADCCTKYNKKMQWVSPCGMICQQEYLCSKQNQVLLYLNGRYRIRLSINEPTQKLHSRQQRNGASPNVVHSYDSSCLHKAVNYAQMVGIQSFMMIHDSYGVLAADADDMLMCAKKAFIEVFSIDQLAELKRQIANLLPPEAKLPELPEKGDLDIHCIEDSNYFIS